MVASIVVEPTRVEAERATWCSQRWLTRPACGSWRCWPTAGRCVCDIRSAVPIAANLLSYHLRVLREAGLIEGTPPGPLDRLPPQPPTPPAFSPRGRHGRLRRHLDQPAGLRPSRASRRTTMTAPHHAPQPPPHRALTGACTAWGSSTGSCRCGSARRWCSASRSAGSFPVSTTRSTR